MSGNWFSFVARLSGIHSRRYVAVLAIAAVLCGLGAWQAFQNQLTGDITALLPDDAPSVRAMDDLTRRFGATNFLFVLLVAPAGEDLSTDLEGIASSLGECGSIHKVDYRWDVNKLEAQGLYYLDVPQLEKIRDTIKERIRKETLKANPFYVDLGEEEEAGREEAAPIEDEFADLGQVLDEYGEGLALEGDHVYFRKDVDCDAPKDGGDRRCKNRVWGMIITPDQGAADITYAKSLVDDVNRRIAARKLDPSVRVFLSGRYNYMATEANDVLRDLNRVTTVGAVVVAGVVFAFFPSILVLLLIFIPLLIGLAMDFGIVHLTIGQLNVVTTGNFAILFGMGVEYGIQVYSRFREETKRGHAYVEAMTSAVGDTGRAIMLAAATTAMAFLSLVVAKYRGFSQLGWITFIGVVFSFLAAILILPALGKVLTRFKLVRAHKFTGSTVDDVLKRRGQPPRAYVVVICASLVFMALAGWSVYRYDEVYETDYTKLQLTNPEREMAKTYENQLFGMSGEPAVLAASDRKDLAKLVSQIEYIRDNEAGGTIQRIDSILTFVPKDQEEKRGVIREIADIVNQKKMNLAEGDVKVEVDRLRRLTAADPVTLDTLPEDITSRFMSEDGGYLVFVYPTNEILDLRNATRLRDMLSGKRLGREHGATSSSILFAELQATMLDDAPRVITISLLVVILVILLDFLSIRLTLLALIPLFVGILWMLGILSAFDIKVNWINVVAFPAVIGIGVDNGVYVIHRYRMEGASSLRRIVRNLGRAMTASVLTNIAGFGALTLSHHPGLRSLGLLTIIGLVTTFMAAIFFLPAILFVYETASARINLKREAAVTLWTVAFDPVSRGVRGLLRSRGIDSKIVVVDELPPSDREATVDRLRKISGGRLSLPLVEKGGKAVSATAGMDRISSLLDS